MIDPTHLRSLREVAARGTVTAAAEALGYTTSAISQQMKALSSEVGADLLERDGRGVRITRAGRTLIAHANEILERLEHARVAAAAEGNPELVGTIHLAAFPTAAQRLAALALAAVGREHPLLRVSVSTLETEASLPALRAGTITVAIAHEYNLLPRAPDRGLHRRALFEEPMLLIASAGSMPAGPVELEELADLRWIAGPPQSTCGDAMRRACNAAGFEPAIDHLTADYAVTVSLVAAGGGVALVPRLGIGPSAHVDVRPLTGCPLVRKVFAATQAGHQHAAGTSALLAHLEQAAAKLDSEPHAVVEN